MLPAGGLSATIDTYLRVGARQEPASNQGVHIADSIALRGGDESAVATAEAVEGFVVAVRNVSDTAALAKARHLCAHFLQRLGEFACPAFDFTEEVQQRLDRCDSRVLAVVVCNLPGECLGNARLNSDRFPTSRTRLAQFALEVVDD